VGRVHLGLRLNGADAADTRITLNFIFTHTGEPIAVELANEALTHVSGRPHRTQTPTLTVTRNALDRFILGETTLQDEAKSGEIAVASGSGPLETRLRCRTASTLVQHHRALSRPYRPGHLRGREARTTWGPESM